MVLLLSFEGGIYGGLISDLYLIKGYTRKRK